MIEVHMSENSIVKPTKNCKKKMGEEKGDKKE
jgi:hypothetical protein